MGRRFGCERNAACGEQRAVENGPWLWPVPCHLAVAVSGGRGSCRGGRPREGQARDGIGGDRRSGRGDSFGRGVSVTLSRQISVLPIRQCVISLFQPFNH